MRSEHEIFDAIDGLVVQMLKVADRGEELAPHAEWLAFCGVIRDAAYQFRATVEKQKLAPTGPGSDPSRMSDSELFIQ